MTTHPLFGLDIAAIVNDSIASAGGIRRGVLMQTTEGARTPGSLSGGRAVTETTHAFNGFVDNRDETRVGGTLVTRGGQFVSLLGASITPVTIPRSGDKISLDGVSYRVLELVETDPAGALYRVSVEKA